MRFVASSLLALVLSVAGQAQSTLLPFPDPAKIVKDDKHREHNQLFVHEFKVSALYTADGVVKCRWQIHPAQDFKMSPSGKWLGDRLFGKVELWSTGTLMACDSPARN